MAVSSGSDGERPILAGRAYRSTRLFLAFFALTMLVGLHRLVGHGIAATFRARGAVPR
jgi:hypothetical protein